MEIEKRKHFTTDSIILTTAQCIFNEKVLQRWPTLMKDPNNPVLWIRNDYFPDPDPTVQMVSDPPWIFSFVFPSCEHIMWDEIYAF